MEMSGNITDQWGMDSLDHLTWEDIQDYSLLALNTITAAAGSPLMECSAPAERPRKIAKSSSWDSSCTEDLKPVIMAPSASSCPTILSFGNPASPICDQSQLYEALTAGGRKRSYGATVAHEVVKKASVAATTRSPSHNQDHVIAERKRRENLTRKFIALSAMVPGLKKMDKASVLGEAIKHLKHLQEKVKNLEEQAAAKRAVDSAVVVKKVQISSSAEDCNSSCDENFEDHDESQLPEIEVRLSEKSVLVKIHCDNRKGLLARALSEVEKLNLTVTSTSAVPFAASSLDITVMAQIEEGFSMTVKDIVKNLNSSLRELI